MPKHIQYILEDTQANVLLVDAGNTAVAGQFYYATDTEETYIGLGDGSLRLVGAGGLSKLGVITADPAPALEGIYSLDASGAAFDFTLPAATGSQSRIILSTQDVATNNVTIKVQSGEDLNDTTDGTMVLALDGKQYQAIDRNTGKWDVVLLGGSNAIDIYEEAFDATASWGAASGGYYTIAIAAAAHGKATDVKMIQVQNDNGTSYVLLSSDSVEINKTTGDVSLIVTETPDGRFAGRILIL